ncbi:outer membrane beta-barrel protein [Niabella drilacis]|uniref:Outer membrane protein beta-barrel domain-containing protein n=1 Tax=Niabella drilacis (strain DSM 25811 / CCM 8410 / CCUG 62505 / LMG 26954 / E90) TaxID=1285928 RepID=A0A1G6LT69_NIADE|nr:outer membrane beta-barrel protein [Niabella drilacis]SDC46462.1 Outer membrane protein beta-barrel domain-containing protein [Niabella drilacis]
MKKEIFITTLFAFCCLIHAHAQTEKGSTLIGGSINFNNNQLNGTDHIKSGTVQLKIGHAFTPNMLWGVQGGYLFGDKANNTSPGHSGFSAGVFNRVYKPLSNAFHLFGESAAGYSHLSSRISAASDKRSMYDAVSLGFTPGLSYSVLDWARIELMLPNIFSVNYTQNHTGPGTTEKTFAARTTIGRDALHTLGLGFSVVF